MQKLHITQFFLLSALFLNTAVFSMDAVHLDTHEASAIISVTSNNHDSLSKQEVIQTLIKSVETLQAHEEDYIDLFENHITPQIIQTIRKNVFSNQEIISLLKNLERSATSTHSVLKEILILRFSFIQSRVKNCTTFYAHMNESPDTIGDILYGPTDPKIFDKLNADQQFLAQKAVDKYQTYNRLILGLLSITDIRTLPAQTKTILRASPSLCKIIETGSKELGLPDETFSLSNEKKLMSDWEYYITHIRADVLIPITMYSSFHKEETKTYITPYEMKQMNPGWNHPYADSELPYPEFLKPYEVKKNITQTETIPATEAITETISMQPDHSEILIQDELRQDTPDSVEINSSAIKSIIDDTLENIPDLVPTEQKIDTPPVEKARPRGMRLFHNQQTISDQPRAELKGKHQKTLEALFHYQEFSSVTYGHFAALWRHINGLNSIQESSGGSHKELLDRNGNVVTGIFAHNNSQTFGKRTIKYIRDALIQIGYEA